MTIYVAFLRGINVGGHNKIKMTDLKSLFESLGLDNVKTYIQSGNVLFESEEDLEGLRERIEQEINRVFGFSVTVIIKSGSELQQIVKECPFPTDNLNEGESVHISLLVDFPLAEGIDKLKKFESKEDEYIIDGKVVYLFFRVPVHKSKLAVQVQKLGEATMRNWNTMNKLSLMASEMR